jgi:hypothetical protein
MVGRGVLRRERCSRQKRGWPPAALPSVYRSRRLQGSPVRPAPADAQDTVSRMVSRQRFPPGVAYNEIRDEPEKGEARGLALFISDRPDTDQFDAISSRRRRPVKASASLTV